MTILAARIAASTTAYAVPSMTKTERKMKSYAYYRLPYADRYTKVESDNEPLALGSLEAVGRDAGFCIAPFDTGGGGSPCAARPVLVILPDKVSTHDITTQDYDNDETYATMAGSTPDDAYTQTFRTYHEAVSDGTFRKLVLARHKVVERKGGATEEAHEAMFLRACRVFPRLMIMLFSTPQSGTWIIASPEILVKGRGDVYHTVALAGTMPYREGFAEWSAKNKTEQNIVEKYIHETIQPLATEIIKDGPYTVRAGNLVHLRTDFRFKVQHNADGTPDREALGRLLSRLHPTPAVCGLPKHEAHDFIMKNEGQDRRYYSGFAGPVGINGETHLYVSLRCAELGDETMTAYAGGGIMPDSTCTAEWRETEMKMNTILAI